MNSGLCELFNSLDILIDNIRSEIDDESTINICYDSTKYFTMNGDIIAKILNIDKKNMDNVFLLEGPIPDSYIILMNSDEDEIKETVNIWNWKVFFGVIEDNYYIVDEKNLYTEKSLISEDLKINNMNPLEALFNILYKNVNLEDFKNELLFMSKWDKKTHSKEVVEQALNTALRVVMLGNKHIDNLGHSIITDIDGENIYNHNLNSLSLELYKTVKNCARNGSNTHNLFTFVDNQKKVKKKGNQPVVNSLSVDGILMSYLIENGLIDKLKVLLKTDKSGISVNYHHSKKNRISKIYLEW